MRNGFSLSKNVCKISGGMKLYTSADHVMGLVMRGTKLVYDGPEVVRVHERELFYIPAGRYYADELPDGEHPYEEVVVSFSPGQLSRTLALLSAHFGAVPDGHCKCPECSDSNAVVFPVWRAMSSYFASLAPYIRSGAPNSTIEQIKMAELIALVISNPDCCIQNRIFGGGDTESEDFEQVVRANIFTDASLEDLARMTNRSLTAFKKEFRRRFHESPHRWITRQRLAHARMLLISTSMPVADIGTECMLPNPSHFIKVFGGEFGITPAAYRKRHLEEEFV